MEKKEKITEIVKKEKQSPKTVGDKYIDTLSREAEIVMKGMGLQLSAEVKNSLFNLGLACEKTIKDKNITWEQINKDGLPSKLLYYAQLNLNPANNELYILPYKSGDKYVLNFEESYLGKKKKVKKFSADKLIDAITFVVREEDIYEPEINILTGDTLVYNPKPFNDGKIIGAVCYLRYENESRNRIVEMSINELEQVKEASKAKMGGKISPAWTKWESEMFKKAVLKRALKDVEIEVPVEYQTAYLETEEMDNSNYDLYNETIDRKTVIVHQDDKKAVKDATYTVTKESKNEKEQELSISEVNIAEFE